MDISAEQKSVGRMSGLRVLLVHGFAVLMVFAFVNTFSLWRAFGREFGTGARDALPWIALLSLIVILAVIGFRRGRQIMRSWYWLAAAALVAGVGLSITDPAFSAKRIHVPQYFLLAVVTWLALPRKFRTAATPLFTLVAVALYGMHDEFLQGLHARRTYGLRDMTVNLCGATSGTLVLIGFASSRKDKAIRAVGWSVSPSAVLALVAAVSGAMLLAWAGTGYRNDLIPYWAVLPVLAGALWLMLAVDRVPLVGDRLALLAIAVNCTAFLAYPVLTDVARLDFA